MGTANTVDQRILERAESKRRLEKMVMHKGRFKGKGKEVNQLAADELLELLQDDGREVLHATDATVLSKQELNQVLDRGFGDASKAADDKVAEGKAFRVLDVDQGRQTLF